MADANDAATLPDARPLYVQVKDILTKRIRSGAWGPGQLLPSEIRLAAELGVSQGTVRKALDALTDASVVERKQGLGTFVVEHTAAKVLFKFFQIYDDCGERVQPGSGPTRIERRDASKDVAAWLAVTPGSPVFEITRLRTHNGRPFMAETVFLSEALFPGLYERDEIPNTLYDMFQRDYGITIGRVQEETTAVQATKTLAKKLEAAPGAALLKIDRVAYDIEGHPIERRISNCAMGKLRYRASLS